jgi:hypothetical protein
LSGDWFICKCKGGLSRFEIEGSIFIII